MRLDTQEFRLKGIPICRGIAIGKPYFFQMIEDKIPNFKIKMEDADKEVGRYKEAIAKTFLDIEKLKKKLQEEGFLEGFQILEAELHLMQDPLLINEVERQIRKQLRNAESIFKEIVAAYEKKFALIEEPLFRDRFKEIRDIARRLMSHLLQSVPISLNAIPKGSIVFAKELTTTDIAEIDHEAVVAFVTCHGGTASHAAILAKAKGTPYITRVEYESLESLINCELILDGRTGEIIVNPEKKTKRNYLQLNKQLINHDLKLNEVKNLDCKTLDGSLVELHANIEASSEIELLHQFGAAGVGLFRSEHAFIREKGFPSEEEQYLIYKKCILEMKGLPIIIRTFDVGGDKFFSDQPLKEENNPYLGCRAIRFLLKEKDLFKAQLSAILRAAVDGDVKVMFPMVSCVQELIDAKNLIKEVTKELTNNSKKFAKKIKIGCMIEVPSAAILTDLLAKECDFLSIGTNDLIQYALAVDRGNHALSHLYSPTHPSIIRLIQLIIEKAKQEKTPVMLCGEIASDPRFTALLLGLGCEELSVASRYLPRIKNAIRSTTMKAARQLAKKVLTLTSPVKIQKLLDAHYRKNVPDDIFYNI